MDGTDQGTGRGHCEVQDLAVNGSGNSGPLHVQLETLSGSGCPVVIRELVTSLGGLVFVLVVLRWFRCVKVQLKTSCGFDHARVGSL